ncbi:uncharacterized protein LOC129002308 [Macrosteles quadrilineatus]|uniref:uncharacterized protein LOC129002308 n=1 Tax=Macrosteles quadrilineatus TaxID=74068 RepID=UPI0023E2FAA3|nr:uncharacterized protein LOC129002308 [Macrosteles quadrilineatus]
MSDISESSISQFLLALDGREEADATTAFTSSTATTVIAKFGSKAGQSATDVPTEELSFRDFVRMHPELGWNVDDIKDEDEEPLPIAMLPGELPSMEVSKTRSDKSSSPDSMMRILLEPPPSMLVSEASLEPGKSPGSSHLDKSSSSDSMMRTLLEPPPSMLMSEPSFELRQSSSVSHKKVHKSAVDQTLGFHVQPDNKDSRKSSSSDRSHHRKRRHDRRIEHRSTSTSSDGRSARGLFQTVLEKPKRLRKRAIDIDPGTLGVATLSRVLREEEMLDRELEEDARSIGYPREPPPCACGVSKHPLCWSDAHIQKVHNYSFLLCCEDLLLDEQLILAANNTNTIVVYNIPMTSTNPLKLKAEQVLKYIDVEIGFGDRTCFNIFHYVQKSDRKMYMAVSHKRVVGIVVAEKLLQAHRILRQNRSYMDLEENPVPVRVGINRLWVHMSLRRQHLATLLCDLVGQRFYEKEKLKKEDFAFNEISDSLVLFAKIYLQTLRPPLYCSLE